MTGVDAINLQMVMNTFDYKSEIGNTLAPLQLSEGEEMACIEQGLAYAKCKGVAMRLATSKARSPGEPCHWPFDRAFISVEGEVVPCCTIADPCVASMGNVFNDSFAQIWIGERYQAFRQTILSQQLLAPCKSCYAKAHRDLIAGLRFQSTGKLPAGERR